MEPTSPPCPPAATRSPLTIGTTPSSGRAPRAPLTQTVNPVSTVSTTTTLTSSANPSVYGQALTFTATVSVVAPNTGTPTGTVTFKDGGTTLGTGTLNASGVATFSTLALSVVSHSITAVYGGDTNDQGGTPGRDRDGRQGQHHDRAHRIAQLVGLRPVGHLHRNHLGHRAPAHPPARSPSMTARPLWAPARSAPAAASPRPPSPPRPWRSARIRRSGRSTAAMATSRTAPPRP